MASTVRKAFGRTLLRVHRDYDIVYREAVIFTNRNKQQISHADEDARKFRACLVPYLSVVDQNFFSSSSNSDLPFS